MKLSSAITLKEESLLSEEERKDRVSFSICLDDTDKDDKVKTYVTKFGSGSAEDWLRFLQEAKKVSDSKGWASKPKQLHAMYGILFKGQAEALYTRLMTSTVTPSPALDVRIKDALDKMTLEYLPIDCAKNTIRYLSQVKKPYEMSVEAFYNRIKAIDAYLPLMPGPMNASLGQDQLFSLVENSVPQEWRHKLHLHQTLGKDLEISTMVQYFKILEINETKSKQNPMTPRGEKAKKNRPVDAIKDVNRPMKIQTRPVRRQALLRFQSVQVNVKILPESGALYIKPRVITPPNVDQQLKKRSTKQIRSRQRIRRTLGRRIPRKRSMKSNRRKSVVDLNLTRRYIH